MGLLSARFNGVGRALTVLYECKRLYERCAPITFRTSKQTQPLFLISSSPQTNKFYFPQSKNTLQDRCFAVVHLINVPFLLGYYPLIHTQQSSEPSVLS